MIMVAIGVGGGDGSRWWPDYHTNHNIDIDMQHSDSSL